MKKFIVFSHTASMIILTACVSNSTYESNVDYTKTFKVPYTDVWRAIQQTLLNYPMNINNMETGHIRTLYITGKQRYQPPHQEKNTPLPPGYQYRLDVHLLKGKKKTRVIVSKTARLQKDFFSDPKEMNSDGFEEKALLYRIQRELFIEKTLKKKKRKKK